MKRLQERGFESLPSSTKTNPRDQVKSISTTIKADASSIRHIGSTQHACEEEEGNYGSKFTKAYGASHINEPLPRNRRKAQGVSLYLLYYNTCFDNALVDLGASVSVMPLSEPTLNLVLEDMNAYRDEGMGDIIAGEPFLREVRIKTKHLEGIITLYNGNDKVTYQMV
ncbi:hypothetical protein Tco_1114138 [Tanacetum coccineum]|uniref:Uncharacterized protein n=1 Tax=Tanacetum coccineum TaxID=301880 RepID=A0ABQ5IVN8_9ASTR